MSRLIRTDVRLPEAVRPPHMPRARFIRAGLCEPRTPEANPAYPPHVPKSDEQRLEEAVEVARLAALPMRELAERVKARWLAQDVKVREGATPAEIDAFETRHELRLPAELQDYFSVVNGMDDCQADNELFEFLSLDRISAEYENFAAPEGYEHGLVFMQFLIYSWWCMIGLRSDEPEACPVLHADRMGGPILASSLREFLAMYLVDPESIY